MLAPHTAHAAATSLTLIWQGVVGADGYKVERASASTGPWSQIGQTVSNVTSFTNTGLTPATVYYYRVRSFNEFGDSEPSETVAGTTSPAAPTNLTATAVSSSQVNLAWQNNSTGQTAVKVERATASTGPWSQIASLSGSATSYSNTGLAALTTYYYRVRASNTGGDSAYSATANAQTSAPPDTTAPSTPTGLVATGIATNQIRLTWNPSTDTGGSGLAGYRVYRSGTLITTTTATNYTDSGRSPNTQYCYTVAAYDNAGNSSAQTASACATTLPLPPNAPTGLTASAVSSNQINLAWQNNSTGQTAVKVERATASTGPWSQIALLSGSATSYSNTGLAASTRYYYRVRASNAGGDSAYSATANAQTSAPPDTTAPSTPTGLVATGIATNQIRLTWNPSTDTGGSGLAGYRVYRSGTLITTTTATNYTDSGRSPNTQYCYTVAAYDNAGNSSAQTASACATTVPLPPNAPTGLTASAVSSNQINLAWQNNSTGQTAVKVERATASTGPWSQIALLSGSATSYANTGLAASTRYYYRVRASNAGGDSAYSATANAQTSAPPDTTAPSTPTGLVATGIATNQIRLTWNPSTDTGGSGLAGYRVYRSGTLITTTTATNYTDAGRSPNTQYCYTVAAYDNAGNSSAQTASACATTVPLPPNAPTGLTASAVSSNQINLAWQNNSTGQTAVKVERATASTGPWSQIALLSGSATSYANTGLAASTRYYYRVRASNAGGDSAYSATANAQTSAPPDTTAPSTPTGLVATGIATNQIRLTWNPSTDTGGSGLAGYRVYRDGMIIASTASTSFVDTNLKPATEYCYRVVAYDDVGNNSTQSANVCATTLPPAEGVLPMAAKYEGLVLHPTSPTHADSGTISVTVRADGSCSASIGLGGTRFTFSSQFNTQGTSSAQIPRSGTTPLTVNLTIEGTHREITGTVADGTRTAEVLAPRRFWSRDLPCPWAGTYRVKIAPPDDGSADQPEGYGYGTLTVRADGVAGFAGYLADGQRVFRTAFLSEEGHFPLYALLYRRGGACVSWLTLSPDGPVTGVLDWFRPAGTSGFYTNGFVTTCDVTGGNTTAALGLTAAAEGTSLELTLGGTEFPGGITRQFWESAQGRISTVPSSDRTVTIRLLRRSGEFYGYLRPTTTGPLLRFRGMLDLTGATGDGFYLGPTKTGYAHLHTAP